MTLAWLLAQLALCALLIARAGFVPSRRSSLGGAAIRRLSPRRRFVSVR